MRAEKTLEQRVRDSDFVRNARVYDVSLSLFNLILNLMHYKVTVEGADKIKEYTNSSYLLAFKHQSVADFPVLAAALRNNKNHPWILVKKEVYAEYPRIFSWWFSHMGAIPVDRPRSGDSLDTSLIDATANYVKNSLENGKAFAFAPEATRMPGTMGKCYPLFFRIALELSEQGINVPIITAGIEYKYPMKPYLPGGSAIVRFNVVFPSDYKESTILRNISRLTRDVKGILARDSGILKY